MYICVDTLISYKHCFNYFQNVVFASRKLFKLGEPDMQDIAGEAEMNS